MKKHIKLLIRISLAIVLLIFGIFSAVFICVEAKVLKAEQKYEETKSDADLINLVLSLQDSCRSKAKIQYAQELLNSITEEGIRNSELSKTSYINALDTVSPKEIAIDLYFYTLLYAGEYELFISDFQKLYPLLSYNMQITENMLIRDIYWQTEDVQVLDTGISAYLKVSETTSDEVLKEECIYQSHLLNEMKSNIDK